jgi:hypothetical protein
MVKLFFTTNEFTSTRDIIYFMLKYFRTIACWPELVFGTHYVKPINELLMLIKIIDLIPVSLITFIRGHITAHLLIFSTHCFKTPHHLCVPKVMKSAILNLLEPSGPHRACNGTSLSFTFVLKQDIYAESVFRWYGLKQISFALCSVWHMCTKNTEIYGLKGNIIELFHI